MANAYDIHKTMSEENTDIRHLVQSLKFLRSAQGIANSTKKKNAYYSNFMPSLYIKAE